MPWVSFVAALTQEPLAGGYSFQGYHALFLKQRKEGAKTMFQRISLPKTYPLSFIFISNSSNKLGYNPASNKRTSSDKSYFSFLYQLIKFLTLFILICINVVAIIGTIYISLNINNQRMSHSQKAVYSTVLVDLPTSDSPQNPDPSHPMFYFKHRNDYLIQLSNRYSTQQRLSTMDLKRNAKVGFYLSQYNRVQEQLSKEEAIRRSYLKSDQFSTIFEEQIDQRRQAERQKREQQKLKQDLEEMWLANEQAYQPPQKDVQLGPVKKQQRPQEYSSMQGSKEGYRTVLMDSAADPVKQKQLYLLNLQIGKLKLEESLDKKVENKLHSCQNLNLLSRLSNNILSAYMVHFDEIYALLIDEILEEEVYFLNSATDKKQRQQDAGSRDPWSDYEDLKTLQMMDLVRRLDQLCDE